MIYEFGTEQVNQKLCKKEESGYQSNVTERNMVVTVKFQKKKRCEVCRNSLCDKAHITGNFCLMVVIFFNSIHFLFSTPNVFNSFMFDRKMLITTFCLVTVICHYHYRSRIIGLFKIMRYFYFKDKVVFNADLTFIHPFKNHKNTSFLFLLDYIANIRYIH